ncbi:DUF2225 domain-containing protein [Sutcliffiella horikoshii]|uniref:DUF2225 domain-containing protein n=1 Tax=Sutcliffiella horikoshii TaxID=79883 RepID=UPI001F36AC4F|nr:DUF2225 domain-containing protein [Sutcliffiella horikoshii]MCG1021763.1 DUF2225 domain-containing protein [Sutcliffiella horikoshii]
MEQYYKRDISCGNCNHSYSTLKVKSRYIRPLTHDTDFCSTYHSEETNPLLYYVSVCPHCGYAVTDEFSNKFTAESLQAIRTKIQKHWQFKDFGQTRTVKTAINAYKLGIYSGIIKKETAIVMAGLYLRLAWIYRTVEKNTTQEQRFLKLAVEQFEISYSTGDFEEKEMSEIKLLYFIGDLHTRLENERQAFRYFQLVIQHKTKEKEKRLVEKARERWYEIRTATKLQATS